MFPWLRKVYLDHNATTPVHPAVRREMERALAKFNGNPSSLHTEGRAARGIVDEARKKVAAMLGCNPDKVYFTSGGTEGNNAVIKGVSRQSGRMHIVTSKIEHESILGACRQVAEAGGSVTHLKAGQDGRVDPGEVQAAIRPDTALVSIMHGNNETGAVNDVAAIARIAAAAQVPFHTDAVQTFGKVPTIVDEIGCEFLTLSAHKINGPKGAGAVYWRGNTKWNPLVFGGDQEHRVRAGTEGVHQIAGLGKAAELAACRMESEHARLLEIREWFLAGLKEVYPAVRLNGAAGEWQLPGTMNATFPGKEGIRLLAGLDCYEVGVSIGSACTADRIEPSHVLLGMDMSVEDALATIRMSMGTTTSRRDMKYVLKVLREVLREDPKGFAYMDPQHLDEDRIKSGKIFLIDLRFPYERMLYPTIPGAMEWSHIYFNRFIRRIPSDKQVIMMCGTGVFSTSAGYRLARSGHPDVKVVYGGYAAWRNLHPGLVEKLRG